MDVARLTNRASRSGMGSLSELPEYIITTFLPSARPLLERYPRLFRLLGVLVAFYYFGPVSRLRDLWSQCSGLLVSSVQVTSDEDLFNYLAAFLAEKRAIRPNQSLHAITNPLQANRRSRHDPDYEETAQKNARKPRQVNYEQGQGLQIFMHDKRLFWVQRADGEGHSYYGNRYKRQEVLKFSCLGRSVTPIKNLLEEVYMMNKEKERSLTVIRRPYGSGYGSRLTWSRLTAKRRRQLDTVILQESQTAAVLADVEEYMSETTKTFYANHGIPYRRGYLFHGPPGCGKTSFCLALASHFDLDVYILTLLDKDITDTDLMSLLNQLPTPSLLLLEDIDEAGLNRKGKSMSGSSRRGKNRRSKLKEGVVTTEDDLESDDESNERKTQVTLSGLLNAIDGVAAPEGHILIMTTNKPHELDDALVRAGRVSVRVEFSYATHKQAEQIFMRMYVDLNESTLAARSKVSTATGSAPTSITPESSKQMMSTAPTVSPPEPVEKYSEAGLEQIAREFSALLPEDHLSPADLQDYLLIYKLSPRAAVDNFAAWIENQLAERRRKEEEQEAESQARLEKAERRRQKFRDDLKTALKDEKDNTVEVEDKGQDNKDNNEKKDKHDDKKGNGTTATTEGSEPACATIAGTNSTTTTENITTAI